ncbi:MAG: hypothetical protein ACI9MC_000388 [Kiritimatiellia bacterium]|jgi:hypothetical protein
MKSLVVHLICIACALPLAAAAGPVSVGIGFGATVDLPDQTSGANVRFGPGGSLLIPVAYDLTAASRLRLNLRADVAAGQDEVSWRRFAGDDPVFLVSDDHWTMLSSAGVSVGLDVSPVSNLPFTPYGGAEVGLAWVGTWHSFGVSEAGVDTNILFGPDNDLADANNIDPYATSIALTTGLNVGMQYPLSSGLDVFVETGYSVAFLSQSPLQKTPIALEARRESFVWNILRVQAGVSFSL